MTRAGPRGNRDPGGDVRAVRYTLNTCDDILTTTRDNNKCVLLNPPLLEAAY